MNKLFLASYFTGAADLFFEFTKNNCSGKKVVFIPTASLHEKITFYIDADKKTLKKFGLEIDELEISTSPKNEISDKILSADYIFVEGGNTFFLLQELKRTGVDKLIIEHISNEKLYIGASAGSMILSPNIEYVRYMDNPDNARGLNNDFSGLSVIDFYIVPHYTNFPFKKAAAKIISEYSDKLDLRPINNNQVVIVDGNKIETLTSSKKAKNSK